MIGVVPIYKEDLMSNPYIDQPNENLRILVHPEKHEPSNSHSHYVVEWEANGLIKALGVQFQNGPIAENGVNGLTNEALLEIVKHRLQCFQAGQFACAENSVALIAVETALEVLYKRTADRQKRGVEGKNEP